MASKETWKRRVLRKLAEELEGAKLEDLIRGMETDRYGRLVFCDEILSEAELRRATESVAAVREELLQRYDRLGGRPPEVEDDGEPDDDGIPEEPPADDGEHDDDGTPDPEPELTDDNGAGLDEGEPDESDAEKPDAKQVFDRAEARKDRAVAKAKADLGVIHEELLAEVRRGAPEGFEIDAFIVGDVDEEPEPEPAPVEEQARSVRREVSKPADVAARAIEKLRAEAEDEGDGPVGSDILAQIANLKPQL